MTTEDAVFTLDDMAGFGGRWTHLPHEDADSQPTQKDLAFLAYLQGLQGTIFGILPSLLWNESVMAVSIAGRFNPDYLDAFKRYQAGKASAIASPGFGYNAASEGRMNEEGFYMGPTVAITARADTEHDFPAGGKMLASHVLAPVRDLLVAQGLSCFLAQGGEFPDKDDASAVVLDISDPHLLTKLKPLFMRYFPVNSAGQIRLVEQHRFTEEERGLYRHLMLKALERLGEDIGASSNDEITSRHNISLNTELTALNPSISGQVEYQMGFIREPLQLMRHVLSPQELAQILGSLAALVTGRHLSRTVRAGEAIPSIPLR